MGEASKHAATVDKKTDHRSRKTRETRLPLSRDRGISHPTRSDTSKLPYTALLHERSFARAHCTQQQSTARSSSKKNLPSSECEEIPSISPKAKAKQISRISWLHHSLVTDGTLSPCSRHSNSFAKAAVRLFWRDCEMTPFLEP